MSIHSKFIVLLLTLFCLPGVALAQQTTGNVRGIVSDPTKAVVPNAKVTLLDKKDKLYVHHAKQWRRRV
ncbi:MAG: hypothetical protein U0Y68_20060 [Blastocatellia bacterium]